MAKVGIVIPCYNQGEYVEETLNSVLNSNYNDYKIAIVNDGSTDKNTIKILNSINLDKCEVISLKNGGLSYARNKGIEHLDCEFILPLDADDTIHPDYISRAMAVFDKNPKMDIVYCKARLFGEESGTLNLPQYSPKKMITNNCIFASAFYRKEMWREIGGYNQNMAYGFEDYDFWLSFVQRDAKVYMIEDALFNYRIKATSMATNLRDNHLTDAHVQLFNNHKSLFEQNIDIQFDKIFNSNNESKLYLDYGNGFNEQNVLVKENVEFGQASELCFNLKDIDIDRIKRLRFDPSDNSCSVNISQIKYIYNDGSEDNIRLSKIKTNGIRTNKQFLFLTSDSNIYLVKGKRSDIEKIIIHVKISRFDNELNVIQSLKAFFKAIKTSFINILER
jgi:glycosyltransferase involved in cell wall biosynthesis